MNGKDYLAVPEIRKCQGCAGEYITCHDFVDAAECGIEHIIFIHPTALRQYKIDSVVEKLTS